MITEIKYHNIQILESFLNNKLSSSFRYFQNRSLECLKNHLITVLYLEDEIPIGYGHIDLEGKNWVGICILEGKQNKGYGKKIMEYLLGFAFKNKIFKLNLTVDKDNDKAIKLYKKYNFQIIHEKETFFEMELNLNQNLLELPVSIGEAIDKLTILDIKLEMILDHRRNDVQKEYNILSDKLNFLLADNTLKYYYKILKLVNKSIWVKQDIFRDLKDTDPKRNILCNEIIIENDARFRIKQKINNLCKSDLKEQKGYRPKKALFLSHLGLGDNLTCNGMIRYLSTLYDEVKVIVLQKNLENIKSFYQDDSSINICSLNEIEQVTSNHNSSEISKLKKNKFFEVNYPNYDHFFSGVFKDNPVKDWSNLPFCFYKDVNVPFNVFWDYFHVPDTKESNELYNLVQNYSYIMIHSDSSRGALFNIERLLKKQAINKDQNLIINISSNIYPPEHSLYELAQKFVNKPLFFYKKLLENSNDIYVSNSCLFCLASNLDILTENCFIVNGNYEFWYKDNIYGYKGDKKKFKSITF